MISFEDYKNKIIDKRVVVLGLGISNLPLIDFLNNIGVKNVFVCDKGGRNEETLKNITKKCDDFVSDGKITGYSVGPNYLKNIPNCDIIFRSPGIRPDTPEILMAKNYGATVTSEMQEFLKIVPCHVFAVTGSDGKTTTTTLIYKLLQTEYEKKGRTVWVGGNIGTPLLSKVGEIKRTDFVVLELSSFQLMDLEIDPTVAVITNITPNHLDWHTSYEEYIEAKKKIFINGNESILVTNADNEVTKHFFAKGITRHVSVNNLPKIFKNVRIKVPGRHNVENFLMAYNAVKDYVSDESFKQVAETFGGVPHRIEFVRELDGVKYYNSSIDSSPNRSINTLSVFNDKSVVMLAGGKDKGIPYDAIGESINKKVKKLVLCGPTADVIEDAVKKADGEKPEIFKTNDFVEAVGLCRNISTNGDIVLLSPASTSFDRFNNFEERGNLFKDTVNNF